VSGLHTAQGAHSADAISGAPAAVLSAAGTHPLIRFLGALLIASIALPIAVLGLLSWRAYQDACSDAEDRVRRSVEIIYQHTLKVLETEELSLDRVVEAVQGMSSAQIRSSEAVEKLLQKVNEGKEQISLIWIMDAKGESIAASRRDFKPINAFDRDHFVVQRDRDAGTFIGTLHRGRTTGRFIFILSRRRASADGEFQGVVAMSVSSEYLQGFFASVDGGAGRVAYLIRTDGEILARNPRVDNVQRLHASDPLMHAIPGKEQGITWSVSPADGAEYLIGFHRINSYPLYVAFVIDRATALQPWWFETMFDALILIPTGVLLALVTLLALRRARQERAALVKLAAEADERARIEAQLRQAQKMEALGALTSGLAHDFNNLLTAIRIYVDVIQSALTDTRIRKFADAMIEEIERASNLIRSLLAFARRQPLQLQTFDVNATIQGMLPLLRQSVGPMITIELELAPDLWPVKADVNQTEVAILNLAINARDAMPSGVLRIATANAALNGEPEGLVGSYVSISLIDTGTGMPPEILARAFEPFFTTKAPEKGSGLGLSSVYGFARQSQGTVHITSKPGEGTAVTIYLPRSCDAPVPAASEKAAGEK
jgi:two-component system NtrC family sensor kinase